MAISAVPTVDAETVPASLQADDTQKAHTSTAAKSIEKHISQLLQHISPTPESNAKRQRVIDFVHRLVKQHFRSIGYEVSCERCSTPRPPPPPPPQSLASSNRPR